MCGSKYGFQELQLELSAPKNQPLVAYVVYECQPFPMPLLYLWNSFVLPTVAEEYLAFLLQWLLGV